MKVRLASTAGIVTFLHYLSRKQKYIHKKPISKILQKFICQMGLTT